MAKVFWDTNLFVYLLENHPVFAARVERLWRRMRSRNDQLLTSTLTIGEALVVPIAIKRVDLEQRYLSFFRSPKIGVLPFGFEAAAIYAQTRQDRAISAPDAIQLACAAAAKVDLFITNDERLSRKVIPGIQFITSLGRAPV